MTELSQIKFSAEQLNDFERIENVFENKEALRILQQYLEMNERHKHLKVFVGTKMKDMPEREQKQFQILSSEFRSYLEANHYNKKTEKLCWIF